MIHVEVLAQTTEEYVTVSYEHDFGQPSGP
jgi:hypothetical protein